MGSALMGSAQFMFFDRDFLGTPVNLIFIIRKVPGRTFFLNLSKFITFAAATLVLTPFVRNQGFPVYFVSEGSTFEARRPRPDAGEPPSGAIESEKGEVLLRGVGTLRYFSILSENSACQVPICAVAA